MSNMSCVKTMLLWVNSLNTSVLYQQDNAFNNFKSQSNIMGKTLSCQIGYLVC